MTTINVNYSAMAAGHEGLVATWGRIEGHLADLDSAIAATADMRSEALASYVALKAKWDASAADRQAMLHALAASVDAAAQSYREVDAAAAAQFAL
jgi:uncharacterized protein YukE